MQLGSQIQDHTPNRKNAITISSSLVPHGKSRNEEMRYGNQEMIEKCKRGNEKQIALVCSESKACIYYAHNESSVMLH